MATAIRLQLYSYDQLVAEIQRTTSITLSQRDLAHPTAGLVELLYMRFIKILFSLEFENYVSDLYEECEPQYADTFVLKNILRYLRIILRLSSVTAWVDGRTPVPFDTIRISDITEPSPARTKVILSCLINLVNLHDGELKFYGSSKLQLERLTEEKTKCAKDIEALTAEVEEQRSVVDQRRKLLEDDELKKQERTLELAEADKARKRTKQELKDIKSEIEEKMQKLESVNKQVSECERKNVDLQRRLVKSPERVKSNISDMGDEVVKKKGQVQALEDLNRAFRSKVDRLNDIITNNKAIKAHLVTIEDVLKEKGTQASLVHSMMEDIKKLKIDHKDELDKKDTWEKKGEAARDRIATFESRASNERKVLAEKTQEVNEEYERATRERSEGDHRFDEGKEMAMELEREIATMIADTERAIREALGDYWRMMKQADEYISVIAKRLQLPLPTS